MAVLLLLGLVVTSIAHAQMSPPAAGASSANAPAVPADPLGRETPAGTVLGFIHAAEKDNYERAAQYLAPPRTPKAAQELARQLKTVLDRRLSPSDISQLSQKPEGRLEDDLAPGVERIGQVRTDGEPVEIVLERLERKGAPPIWVFSAQTLKSVPAIYEELQPTLIERLLPASWRDRHLLGVATWEWIILLLAIPVAFALAWVLKRAFRKLLHVLFSRFMKEQADTMLLSVKAPMRVVAAAFAVALWASLTILPLLTRLFWRRVAVAAAIVGVSWFLLRLIDGLGQMSHAYLRLRNQSGKVAVSQLLWRLAKLAVALTAGLALLYLMGLNLTAALAGLGIGGIAVALAAQKTLENFFGGVMVISDQPVRVGDFCRIGDVTGVVEDIGLRSTRIRTLERTMVSIPNGQTAAVNVENFGVRDKIWFRPTIGLRYETTADQLRYVLAEIRQLLYAHPMVENASARIRFVRFGASSLDLEIFAYVLTSDYTTFLEVQEDILLRIMDLVEAAGTGIAFPSSVTYFARDAGLDREKTHAAGEAVKRWREQRDLPFPNFRPERIGEIADRLEYPPPDSSVRPERPR